MAGPIITVAIRYEQDVVLARQCTRQIAKELGFDAQDQTRLATAVSELARNAFVYARGGKIEFSVQGSTPPQLFQINIRDQGPGIGNLKEILEGRYRSHTGMGLGIIGARRLVDQCDIHTRGGAGTEIVLKKLVPRQTPMITQERSAEIAATLAASRPSDLLDEVKQQNQELLSALSQARDRQDELARLNQELEDTNRGVVALYAELDERANHLRRADELKTSFLSNMSHEFRTPLNSILALSQILLDRTDGELTSEQEVQVAFIRKGAESLLELVNDLLDLAKIEAGKVEVLPIEFNVANLFSALRGMLRPLLAGETVRLVFEEPSSMPTLFSDESKVSQVLRNFIANALKFTERGEVRVSATCNDKDQTITFAVADTGIGIAEADREMIFEEFTQVENSTQRKVKGTGLGLPLCRKLADLLGGTIGLVSEPGLGSTFSLTIPIKHPGKELAAVSPVNIEAELQLDESRLPVIFVEDDAHTRLIYEKFLHGSPFQMIAAANLSQARQVIRQVRPRAIVLDIRLRGEDGWDWLAQLKNDVGSKDIPVLVATNVEDEGKGYALGADEYHLKPLQRGTLLTALERLTGLTPEPKKAPVLERAGHRKRILIVDDQGAARYVLAKYLENERYLIRQARTGRDGLDIARTSIPDFIFLDLDMPDIWGFDVLNSLRNDSATRSIPVAIVTSVTLTDGEREGLERQGCTVINKSQLSKQKVDELLANMFDAPKLTAAADH